MKVKELIRVLRKFRNANILINNKNFAIEAYEDQIGKLNINIKILDK